MIVDTLSPNGEPIEMRISEFGVRNGETSKNKECPRKPMARIESKHERDIMFAVGMACLASISEPGECHTYEEIADFTGHTRQRVQQIAEKGLRKIRAVLYGDKELEKELKMFLENT